MGNAESTPEGSRQHANSSGDKSFPGSAVGNAILDSFPACGSLKDTEDDGTYTPNNNKRGDGNPYNNSGINKFLNQAEALCIQSPSNSEDGFGDNSNGNGNPKQGGGGANGVFDDEYEEFRPRERHDPNNHSNFDPAEGGDRELGANNKASAKPANPTSALFARALVNEVTDNPKTMTPAAMADREKKLLKAQERAKHSGKKGDTSRPVGTPGGVGKPTVLGTIAHALTGTTDPLGTKGNSVGASAMSCAPNPNNHMDDDSMNHHSNNSKSTSVMPPNSMSENRAQVDSNIPDSVVGNGSHGKHTVTIGLSLSRRSSVGHLDTVTRQTAFDFNELQDREYKYVSSTDSSGWRAGGGERGGASGGSTPSPQTPDGFVEDNNENNIFKGLHGSTVVPPGTPTGDNHKVAAPDTVHIPILHIDAESPQAVDAIIAALARGEVFIPHMTIIPESLSVDGVSPPDLVVRFGTERNEDLPPDEWPNWCLEFMHNQLYEYFQNMGARWMKRPFSITLAKKVRWKTVKHMNRYFAHAERVIDAWREKGSQYLDPQLAYIEGGATPEEVSRPHGIYLLRNGVPTNYFAPNFDPPYTTKMTRSLLLNVLGKSWDKKRREWTSEPIPKLITPAMLVTAMCGCGDANAGGFVANEVTLANKIDTSTIPRDALIRSESPKGNKSNNTHHAAPSHHNKRPSMLVQQQEPQKQAQQQQQQQQQPYSQPAQPQTPGALTDLADTDIVSESGHPRGEPSLVSPQQQNQPLSQPKNLGLKKMSLEDSNTAPRKSKKPSLEISTGTTDVDENNKPVSPQGPTSSEKPSKQLDDELDLHLSGSTATSNKSPTHHSSVLSPKYGRAPTPENLRSTRSALTGESKEEENAFHPPDNTSSNENAVGSSAAALDMPAETPGGAGGPKSDYIQSTTGTNSTIMHMNLSADKFMKRDFERRIGRDEKKEEDPKLSLASDEDWLDELGKPLPSPAVTAQGSGKKKKDRTKEELDKERSKQIALIAMVQEQTTKAQARLQYTLNDPAKRELAEAVMNSEKGIKPNKQRHPSVQKNDSGVSLEYSVDSTLLGDGSTTGGSTLMGQTYATDTSVNTMESRKSQRRAKKEAEPTVIKEKEDDLLSSFSLQESTSGEAVPSDEELFEVGWAKALDEKSGSYYYFTLDRAKIVWDNPIGVQHGSTDSMDSGLPESAAAV